MNHFLLFFIVIFPVSTYAATDPKLDAACEKAREAKIAPERKEVIKQCVAGGNSQSYCNEYYNSYGDASGNSGNYTRSKYANLPECIAADKAREDYRAGSDRNNDTRDSDPKRTNYR